MPRPTGTTTAPPPARSPSCAARSPSTASTVASRLTDLGVGDGKAFGAGYAHDVRNPTDQPALSLHAYSPRLSTMTRFRFRGDRLEALGVERAGEEW
ncbi:hypothetical protein G5V59_11560 [Nocardioides sp. W3-2-3]|nr:hypothetical protein [Nocardioides convexus]